ncbi:hypothetical protein L6R50_24615, partial [Myxococcota bacterium]|nr:hypothetical protein [Myxococcota bacterium]
DRPGTGTRRADPVAPRHAPLGGFDPDAPLKIVVTGAPTSPLAARVTYRAAPGGSWSETDLVSTAPGRYVCALRPFAQWAPDGALRLEYAIEVRDAAGKVISRFGTPSAPLVAAAPSPSHAPRTATPAESPWGAVGSGTGGGEEPSPWGNR